MSENFAHEISQGNWKMAFLSFEILLNKKNKMILYHFTARKLPYRLSIMWPSLSTFLAFISV